MEMCCVKTHGFVCKVSIASGSPPAPAPLYSTHAVPLFLSSSPVSVSANVALTAVYCSLLVLCLLKDPHILDCLCV